MTREQAKELLPIITAYVEGKTIEVKDRQNNWNKIKDPNFDEYPMLYRIKPESKYHPFKDVKECWQEMQKHQPVGWIKSKEATEDVYFTITGLTNGNCGVMLNSPGGWSLSGLFDYYTFADGTPFGVKEEE